MNYIDLIIILLIVISAVSGAFKGFVREVSSLLGLIVGIWAAVKFSGFLKTFLVKRWDMDFQYIDIVSFVIVLVAIMIVFAIISKTIEKTIESAKLSTINRILGLVFSAFKTVFFLGLFFILIESLHRSLPILPVKPVNESKFAGSIKTMSLKTFPFIKELFDDVSDEIKKENKFDQQKTSPSTNPTDSIEIIS